MSQVNKFAVIGDPIAQSKSPLMMEAAFQALGYAGSYEKVHVRAVELGETIARFRKENYRGWNVTIPHKVDVMAHLDEIDPDAKHLGAVNTVVNEDGRLIGYNTDGIGYVRSLLEETGFAPAGKKVLFVGAGGAARGVIYAMLKQQPADVAIVNRTVAKAEELVASLTAFGPIRAITEADIADTQWDLIVNTTSVGMYPDMDATPFDERHFGPNMVVSDLIYNPKETLFLRQARLAGAKTHNGLGMFIYQGAYALEYWTGLAAPTSVMRNAVVATL
jgi:shikimate dehydrogenase